MTLHHFPKLCLIRDHERGSATMEYVIVSTFAALLSIAAIAFVKRLVKERVGHMASQIGVETPEFDLSFE